LLVLASMYLIILLDQRKESNKSWASYLILDLTP
jgi:hypothetical protein